MPAEPDTGGQVVAGTYRSGRHDQRTRRRSSRCRVPHVRVAVRQRHAAPRLADPDRPHRHGARAGGTARTHRCWCSCSRTSGPIRGDMHPHAGRGGRAPRLRAHRATRIARVDERTIVIVCVEIGTNSDGAGIARRLLTSAGLECRMGIAERGHDDPKSLLTATVRDAMARTAPSSTGITDPACAPCQHRAMADRQRRRIPSGREAFKERLLRGDTYGLLLGILIVSYVLIALLERSLWERLFISMCSGSSFLLTLHTSHVRARAFRFGVAIVLVDRALDVRAGDRRTRRQRRHRLRDVHAGADRPDRDPQPDPPPRGHRHRDDPRRDLRLRAARHRVRRLYARINDFEPRGFFAQPGPKTNVDFLYFSFITLTTVGYGDLSPRTDTGRVIVTFEAADRAGVPGDAGGTARVDVRPARQPGTRGRGPRRAERSSSSSRAGCR